MRFFKKLTGVLLSMLLIIGSGCGNETQPQSSSQTDLASSSGNEQEVPDFDIQYERMEPTAKLLETYQDLLSPILYEKIGTEMTDEEILIGFKNLYQSARSVYYWYLDGTELQDEVVPSGGKIVDKQDVVWRPAKRIATLGEAYALVDSAFTKRFRRNALLAQTQRFRSYDGKLYINCSSGGIGDPSMPIFDSAKVLAKTPDAILIELEIGCNNDLSIEPEPTIFTLIHQGEFWVLDNWI